MNLTFEWYVGIDYSGAQTPKSSLKGLRVYAADRLTSPEEVEPPPSPRKYWTRRGIAEWLVERLSEGSPTLVGHRPRLFVSAAVFRAARIAARLGVIPLRLPAPLADRRRHLRRFRPGRQQWQWHSPLRQSLLAEANG